METIRRTPLAETPQSATAQMTSRANRSATQWLFNPFSVADTTNWAVTTGVGKLAIGGLTKVTNVTEQVAPNKSKRGEQVVYDSTFNFSGYVENERFALNIANEIVNNYPRRVHRIRALEGVEDNKLVAQIEEILLGEEMAVAYIEGVSEPVPVLTQMLEVLRYNMREVSKTDSPQKALLLAVGKEFESTIADNIKLAIDDLKTPQQDVASKKRAGFDVNAKRNFLALGKPVPEVNLSMGDQTSAQQALVNERTLNALEKLNSLMGGDDAVEGIVDETTVVKDEDLPEGFLTEAEGNQLAAIIAPKEVEMEFVPHPKIVTTSPLSDKQMEKAEEAAKEEEAEEAETVETDTLSTTPTRCAATTASGNQCSNDAVKGSKFCHIEAHQKQ